MATAPRLVRGHADGREGWQGASRTASTAFMSSPARVRMLLLRRRKVKLLASSRMSRLAAPDGPFLIQHSDDAPLNACASRTCTHGYLCPHVAMLAVASSSHATAHPERNEMVSPVLVQHVGRILLAPRRWNGGHLLPQIVKLCLQQVADHGAQG